MSVRCASLCGIGLVHLGRGSPLAQDRHTRCYCRRGSVRVPGSPTAHKSLPPGHPGALEFCVRTPCVRTASLLEAIG